MTIANLLQFLQRGFVLRDNVLLRGELGAFGVHHGFGSAADELLVRKFAFNRSGECLGLFNLFFQAGDFCSRVEDAFERDVEFATGHHGAGAELRLGGLHGNTQVGKSRKFGDDCHAVLHAGFRRGVVHTHHGVQLGGGAHVVAATHATHAFHHGECLVECGFDLRVDERFVGLGPCAADHHFAALEQDAVELFGNERHHRVEQVKHVLQHVAENCHCVLLFGGERFAVDHGLLDLRKRQMLASVMPTQAWARLSAYAFVQVA